MPLGVGVPHPTRWGNCGTGICSRMGKTMNEQHGKFSGDGYPKKIKIRCSKIMRVVPTSYCQTCLKSEECMREALKTKPRITAEQKIIVKGEERVVYA
jgi:hypothetical protein